MSTIYCGHCGNRIEGRYPFCPYCSAPDGGGEPPEGLMQAALRLTPSVRAEIDRMVTKLTPLDELRETLVDVYARRFNDLT